MKSILVIRRDNIGDLVCTTPLIHALRERYPQARIDALVNSYNLPVVTHNPDLNNVYAYTKGKHRAAGESLVGVTWRRLCLMWQLRATRYDLVVLASGGCLSRPLRLARLIRPNHVLGFRDAKVSGADLIDLPVTMPQQREGHEVECLFTLLEPLGITGMPGPLVLRAEPAQQEKARQTLVAKTWYQASRPTIAVHISARKPSQRWPVERFIATLQTLATSGNAQFMLFWAPGDENNPMHPGDDRKAQAIMGGLPEGFPLLAWPTHTLHELIGGLSVCHGMLCSDGGAMHVGAALDLPIACFFGQSEVEHWRPWAVPYRVMQPASKDVSEVPVETALEAMAALWPAIQERVGR
jgi:heptosyltransferase III